ncbi:hypothetical protein AGMMS49983_02720 [Clostridia bacterium]|nr:hypothetical protein AGMMS49983_02720 [Clostridia bacterium]
MLKSVTANLMVESVDDTLAFYKTALGFVEVASVPGANGSLQFAIAAMDGQQLMFQERGNLCEEYPILMTDKVKPSVSIYMTVDNFEGFYAEIQSRIKLLKEEHKTFYGTREFAIQDNNGYVLTIAESN